MSRTRLIHPDGESGGWDRLLTDAVPLDPAEADPVVCLGLAGARWRTFKQWATTTQERAVCAAFARGWNQTKAASALQMSPRRVRQIASGLFNRVVAHDGKCRQSDLWSAEVDEDHPFLGRVRSNRGRRSKKDKQASGDSAYQADMFGGES